MIIENNLCLYLGLPIFFKVDMLSSKTRESKMRYKSAMEDLEDIKAKTNIDYEKYSLFLILLWKCFPLYQESLENAVLFKESIEQGT